MTESGATRAKKAAGDAAPGGESLRRFGRTFLRWWLSELKDLLPDRVRIWLAGDGTRAAIVLEGETLRIAELRGGLVRPLNDLDLVQMPPAKVRDAIRHSFARAGLSGCPVVLGLPEHLVLRRNESLPAGTERRLADVLRLRLESVAPLPPDAFYWGYRTVGPAADGRLSVECVLVKAEAVDNLLARLAELGMELSGAFPAADLPGPPTLNLLPGRLRREPLALWSAANKALAALAAVLAVLALLLNFYRQETALKALNDDLAGLRGRVEEVLALRTGAREQLSGLQAARKMKTEAPSLMGILDEVSRLLPDDTWVSDFRLQGGEITLTGQSRSASSLIGLIERSPVFANARFGSPVVRDPRTGAERFNIEFEWAVAATDKTAQNGGGP